MWSRTFIGLDQQHKPLTNPEGNEKVGLKFITFNPKISLVNKDVLPAMPGTITLTSQVQLHGKKNIKSSKTIIPLSNDRIQHPHSKTSWQSVNQILLKAFILPSKASIDNLMSLSHILKGLGPLGLPDTWLKGHGWKIIKSLYLCLAECSTSKCSLINWSSVLSCEGSLLNRWYSSRDHRSYSSRILFYKWLNHSKSQRQYHYTYLINTVIYTSARRLKSKPKDDFTKNI